MNVLVLGVNGMAGHMISEYLKEAGYEVTGFAREKSTLRCNYIIGDAMDRNTVKNVVRCADFQAVINAVGVLNQSVDAHMAEGIWLNSALPHYLADCLKGTQTRLIHISTDCVFSGNSGSYTEECRADAESYYGRTKALGEIKDDRNLTFRTSIVGPELKADGTGLFHWFMNEEESVNGFTEVIWSGVTTLELAKAICSALENHVTGLYHLTNNQPISKYQLLMLFNQHMRADAVEIKKDASIINNKSLISTRDDWEYKVPSYEQMIWELAEWMEIHREWYKEIYKNWKPRPIHNNKEKDNGFVYR